MVTNVLPRPWPVVAGLAFWSLALLGLSGCLEVRTAGAVLSDLVRGPHSAGFIVGARPDASFVREPGAVYVHTRKGTARVDLDGRNHRLVFPWMLLLDQAPDGAMLALVDETVSDLYLGDPRGIVTRIAVPGLDGRVSSAVFSPDGRTLAVTRFPDTKQPVEEWKKTRDDTVYLVDVATRSVRTVPPLTHDLPVRLAWSLDGSTLWVGVQSFSGPWVQRLDVATGARQNVADFPDGPLRGGALRNQPARCPSTGSRVSWRGAGGDEGLELAEPNGKTRVLVAVRGRVRVHHGENDDEATINDYAFTPTCRHVVFTFGVDHVWIVDTKTGDVGPLLAGSEAVFDLSSRLGAVRAAAEKGPERLPARCGRPTCP